jgi:DNA-binding transcriptional MocR family regulator
VSAAVSRYIREALDGREDLSPTARHLLDRLGHHANADGLAWPSVDTLANQMGVKRITVKRARRELVEAGLIVMIVGGGRGHTNLYAFPKGDHPRAPLAQERGSSTRERGSPTRVNGITGDPRSIHRRVHEVAPTWCDATCPQCDGTGFVSYVHPILGGIGTAHPCPNRQH